MVSSSEVLVNSYRSHWLRSSGDTEYSKYSAVDKTQMWDSKRKTVTGLRWRGLGLCPIWPARIPGNPLSPCGPFCISSRVRPALARQGALGVIPTGCAKNELALDQATWPLPSDRPFFPCIHFPTYKVRISLHLADLSHWPENLTKW